MYIKIIIVDSNENANDIDMNLGSRTVRKVFESENVLECKNSLHDFKTYVFNFKLGRKCSK